MSTEMNTDKKMGRIVNAGFAYLDDVHIDTLQKAGLLRNRTLLSREPLLPHIGRDTSPEDVKETIRLTMNRLVITDEDILITSGFPDVCTYVVEFTSTGTTILVPIVTRTPRGIQLCGFREIIRNGNSHPPIHLFAGSSVREHSKKLERLLKEIRRHGAPK